MAIGNHVDNQLRTFRTIALLEASSFLLLLGATVLKHAADAPLGVQVLGPIHGALFLVYVVLALLVSRPAHWGVVKTVLVLLGAVVPFGGFVVDRWIATSQLNSARVTYDRQ